MNLELLWAAPTATIVHVLTVVPAFAIGTWTLFLSRKGSAAHRHAGRTFALLMSITALTTIFIRSKTGLALDVGPLRFSPIHLFIPLTVNGLWRGLSAIRRGDIDRHRRAMRGLYLGALILAGLFTFLPGRMLNQMFFG